MFTKSFCFYIIVDVQLHPAKTASHDFFVSAVEQMLLFWPVFRCIFPYYIKLNVLFAIYCNLINDHIEDSLRHPEVNRFKLARNINYMIDLSRTISLWVNPCKYFDCSGNLSWVHKLQCVSPNQFWCCDSVMGVLQAISFDGYWYWIADAPE